MGADTDNNRDKPAYIVPRCDQPVEIVHQDEHILVISKPAFLLSQPGRGIENRDSVVTRLVENFATIKLVHRLDLDTSGLMVFALDADSQRYLNRQFAERQVKKHYMAVVAGLVENDNGSIDLPIIADWKNRPRQKICHEKGRNALTHYQVINRDQQQQQTRLLLIPITGRSHQLRLHLREIGHPILGCDLYAPAAVLAASERLKLHAMELGFYHPATGDWQTFYSPVPF